MAFTYGWSARSRRGRRKGDRGKVTATWLSPNLTRRVRNRFRAVKKRRWEGTDERWAVFRSSESGREASVIRSEEFLRQCARHALLASTANHDSAQSAAIPAQAKVLWIRLFQWVNLVLFAEFQSFQKPRSTVSSVERRSITVTGTVQGVGFRPFVHRLASSFSLGGWVKNRSGSVLIEAEGKRRVLDEFLVQLRAACLPLVRIDSLEWLTVPPLGERHFLIEASESGIDGAVFVSPDVAVCRECLRELFDPGDRRYRYAFLNCTNCGPRLTIMRAAPYDRQRTTMRDFAMCAACRQEYEAPDDRRFHAQPIACSDCGPHLELVLAGGERAPFDDPLVYTVCALREGKIAAIKGLGGFHLACDAGNDQAVVELRRRKHRDAKPFAVMVRDVEMANALCELSSHERSLLLSPRAPIVLVRRREGGDIAASVAPGNPCLGIMLPYSPLHHLLMRDLGDVSLVMTSGNRSDEPIAYKNEAAVEQLAGIADLFLLHNRPIHLRCDDSLIRVVGDEELPLRRSRGYAPQPLVLPFKCPQPTLALGGQLKVTFALGQMNHAILSHHLGDLEDYAAYRAFVEAVPHYQRLFEVEPRIIAHDLHPDYASTTYARERAAETGVEVVGVQHHHAHMASCMAEHGLDESVIGVIFDGAGYGIDGTVWGGEFLIGDYRDFRRVGCFRSVLMPGGGGAIREPWRMAMAYLIDSQTERDAAELPEQLFGDRVAPSAIKTIATMIHRGLQSPRTSSVGRLFDAASAIAGLRHEVGFEGQAAMELEWRAAESSDKAVYPFQLSEGERLPLVIDTRPFITAVVRDRLHDVPASDIARRFHNTLVEIVVSVCGRLSEESGLRSVVLSGGVFANSLLTCEASHRLTALGFEVYRHRQVPPGDGGLSLGQLAIAAVRKRA